MAVATLDAGAVAAVDSTGQASEILDLPVHLSDALWRVDSAALSPADRRAAHAGDDQPAGRLDRRDRRRLDAPQRIAQVHGEVTDVLGLAGRVDRRDRLRCQ